MKSSAPTQTDNLNLKPIAHVSSPYRERFGIPRQFGLAPSAHGWLIPHPPWDQAEAWAGITEFSHLWLIWHVHGRPHRPLKTVRPPRLGGNQRVGVFASRSPVRPNPIGLSLVELKHVEHEGGRLRLAIAGLDLLDGTPILDVKPYVAYADCPAHSRSGFAPTPPERLPVDWRDMSAQDRARLTEEETRAIEETLSLDPRPAFHDDPERVYGCRLFDYDVRFRVANGVVRVLALQH